MVTQCQWVMLAAVATLASGATPEQSFKCCDAEKVLPPLLTQDSEQCRRSVGVTDEAVNLEKACRVVECIMTEHGMLNEDKSVKEAEIRKLFEKLELSDDVKRVTSTVLDECFAAHKPDSGEKKICETNAVLLFGCISRKVLSNCPESMWQKTGPGCQVVDKQN